VPSFAKTTEWPRRINKCITLIFCIAQNQRIFIMAILKI